MLIDLIDIKKIIDTLDLRAVLKRLILIEGWKPKHAHAAIQQYRNYLFLRAKYYSQYNEIQLPPSYEIDEVWHAHILHTRDYIDFCNRIFNGYLHHSPHGQSPNLDTNELSDLFSKTQHLYFEEFGEHIHSIKRIPVRKRPTLRNLKKLMNDAVIYG